MTRAQGQPFTKDEIQRIRKLLADTELSMMTIAQRMNCNRSSVARINQQFKVRAYDGERGRDTLSRDDLSSP